MVMLCVLGMSHSIKSRVLDGAPSDTARGCVPRAACARVRPHYWHLVYIFK